MVRQPKPCCSRQSRSHSRLLANWLNSSALLSGFSCLITRSCRSKTGHCKSVTDVIWKHAFVLHMRVMELQMAQQRKPCCSKRPRSHSRLRINWLNTRPLTLFWGLLPHHPQLQKRDSALPVNGFSLGEDGQQPKPCWLKRSCSQSRLLTNWLKASALASGSCCLITRSCTDICH